MEPPIRRVKDTPKRLREVCKYLRTTYGGIDLTAAYDGTTSDRLPPENHVPVHSSDPALTAFAQLGATRLNAARALISFLDHDHQYILAEATAVSPLRQQPKPTGQNTLWLGNTSIPRYLGVCQRLLNGSTTQDDGSVIIPDLLEDPQYGDKWFVSNGPCCRYYAGAPIVSQEGYVIGVYCIFDDRPRSMTPVNEMAMLCDLAAMTMEYFDSLAVREDNRRAEIMVRGLSSFVQGAESLQTMDSVINVAPPAGHTKAVSEPLSPAPDSTSADRNTGAPQSPSSQHGHGTARRPQSDITPGVGMFSNDTEDLFSRAANIIRDCCNLDGVVFFDAFSARADDGKNGHDRRRRSIPTACFSCDESSASSSSSSVTDADELMPRPCRMLGRATESSSVLELTRPGFSQTFPAVELNRLLRKYPDGGILYFNAAGDLLDTDSPDEDGEPQKSNPPTVSFRTDRQKLRSKQVGHSIRSVAPGARSAAFLPLWDYERSRWFAACVLWTTEASRTLSPKVELLYLRAFGNSIMTELSRLDARASDRMKTTFVASISHELRTPLHGILGGAEFLKEGALSFFQADMLDSIESCSLTLLDIVNHVLDYSKINEFRKQTTSNSASHRIAPPQAPPALLHQKRREVDALITAADISAVLEEVVETAFAGQSFALTSARFAHEQWDNRQRQRDPVGHHDPASHEAAESIARKQVRVLLNIPKRSSWTYNIALGAWRRIIMNIVGNALKYTDFGTILITLQSSNEEDPGRQVKLIVSDTGIGMSEYFLQNRLFTPFSQENALSVGTGLGLNIVRQLVDALGGVIDFQSRQAVGTTVSISIPTAADSQVEMLKSPMIDKVTERLKRHKVAVFEPFSTILDPNTAALSMSRTSLTSVRPGTLIIQTLEQWFGATPHYCTGQWNGARVDIILCTEPSFEALASVRASRKSTDRAPVVFFLAMDAFETATLRDDSRVTSKESVVEIMTQPCGPRKLAKALNHALDRYHTASENIPLHELHLQDASQVVPNSQIPLAESLQSPNTSITVLVVDDNPINRRLLIAFLKKKGLAYREAGDGLQALTMYKAANPTFNLVFMDMSMPIMDGMTSTSEIRKYEGLQKMAPATIVAITGLASAAARVEAMNSGVDAFLTKPLKMDVLAPFIDVTLDERAD